MDVIHFILFSNFDILSPGDQLFGDNFAEVVRNIAEGVLVILTHSVLFEPFDSFIN